MFASGFSNAANRSSPLSLYSLIWLRRGMSTAFQERVFSSAGAVMSSSRTSMDAGRAEKLVILKRNAKEINLMQSESSSCPHEC
jgi:hypothetical protein